MFSIWENGLRNFCNDTEIFDENLDWTSLYLDFVVINKSRPNMPKGKKMISDPEKGLVRYEFLDLIVRMSTRKYLNPGKVKTKAEGL